MPANVPPPSTRSRWAWALGSAAALALALVALDAQGHASRRIFDPPAELGGARAFAVGTAADAFRIWESARLRGRRLVVLTGRWSKLRNAEHVPASPGAPAPGDRSLPIDADTALYAAGRLGFVRRLDVVMPTAALERRRAEVATRKEFVPEGLAFSASFEAFERRFAPPQALAVPGEPALVLVEASWFADGAPPRPLEWLASSGVRSDLALVALEDPAATPDQRETARAYAADAGILTVEGLR